MGKLIVLEGTDGSGKATQCAALFGWRTIPCTENGTMRTIQDIHRNVLEAVKEIL
jgi:thymidylate kinase